MDEGDFSREATGKGDEEGKDFRLKGTGSERDRWFSSAALGCVIVYASLPCSAAVFHAISSFFVF